MHTNSNNITTNKRKRDQEIIPPRWLNCPVASDELIADKFIASKTPLGNNFDNEIPFHQRFSPNVIFDRCNEKGVKLGLWIDLTNTKNNRYDAEKIKNKNCKYFKIQCQGHAETPTEEQTTMFTVVVQRFLEEYPDKKILVHCTHGFNRTGFLIVSYLITKMKFNLEDAIKTFSKARPPGIYKSDYLAELYKRYGNTKNCPPPPSLPEWCFEEESSNGETKRFKFNDYNKTPLFMKGVPGVTYVGKTLQATEIQKKVADMCEWERNGFPGLQPVTLDVNNIKLLHEKPYRVSWKADGTRYMMLIDGDDKVFFIDRNNCIFKVHGLKFPHNQLPRHIRNTLVDGEMVIDSIDGKSIPRYLIYDIIKFEGQEVGKTQFPTRLFCIENEIIIPRCRAIQRGIINKEAEPFSVRKKEFWGVEHAGFLSGQKFIKALPHQHDGLIFQPCNEPYRGGTYREALKWKPPNMNSIDFKLKIIKEDGIGIISQRVGQLFVGQQRTPFATMAYTKEIKELNNKIIECKYENNRWKFMRERTDKFYPNSLKTAESVFESIKNPVTQDGLLNYIDRFKYIDEAKERIPPVSSVNLNS